MKYIPSHPPRLLFYILAGWLLCFAAPVRALAPKQHIYQLKVYHLASQGQRNKLDTYLKQAYLPALRRLGISQVGVFEPVADTAADRLLYVFVPFKTVQEFVDLEEALAKDKQYVAAAQAFTNVPFDQPTYTRFESVLLEAFSGMPGVQKPALQSAPGERVYELRSYEAATEHLHLNKVAQFNEGEIKLFDRLGFNAVFYARVLAGSHMPNLMYMTSFENMAEREAHWKAFGEDPEWKKLNALPQYAHNFLRADIMLLHPTPYSGL